MNENSNIPNGPNWEKLLTFLEQDVQDESTLNGEEQQHLAELKKLINETREALSGYDQFNSQERWNSVKEKLNIKDLPSEQLDVTEVPEKVQIKTKRIWPRIIAVAAAVAFIIMGIQFFKSNQRHQVDPISTFVDIQPGKNGATITLSNGKMIQLSDKKNGVIVGKDLKYTDGTAIGEDPDLRQGDVVQLTASTAKGQTYQFTLPDGTHVWLNAESSISFPSQFNREDRRIVLSGEGYFEVYKDKGHPFIVETSKQEVEVLGTHFNINSYTDETAIATTLLEGSVKVTSGNRQQVIKPGFQALNTGTELQVKAANLENVIDWKDGEFNLDGLDFRIAMRKIARWYDVEVIYDPSVPEELESGGWISRNTKLSEVLVLIEKSGLVQFKVEGKNLYVSRAIKPK